MKVSEGRQIYSVSEVNSFAKQTLEQMVFWVEGEIQSVKKNPDWTFHYLDLKDERAMLSCIIDKSLLAEFDQDSTGQVVLAYGNLSLYEPNGKYQFRIWRLEKAGEGTLAAKLEALIKKLKAEGLFDQRYKKQIPAYPKKICVVTSRGSDAYYDFKRHSADKFPIIELYTADVRVQGPRSIKQLLKVLPYVDKQGFDIIVITRGGGSSEDLMAFNDEAVARVIFKMKTPTIVAIGHEANESPAEWVADRRASTPTDAANIACEGYNSILLTLANFKYQLKTSANFYFTTNLQRLDYIYLALQATKLTFRDLTSRLGMVEEVLKRHESYLVADAEGKLASLYAIFQGQAKGIGRHWDKDLEALAKSLLLLSPENTLARGYSVTTNEKGQIVRSIGAIVVGQKIGVKLTGGNLTSKVLTKKEDG